MCFECIVHVCQDPAALLFPIVNSTTLSVPANVLEDSRGSGYLQLDRRWNGDRYGNNESSKLIFNVCVCMCTCVT